MRIRFEKWEGLGNDFVLVRDLSTPLDDAAVRRICDRRLGVGADGVLLVEAADPSSPRMIVRNADGSRPEMCGNGLRCVAGHLCYEGVVTVHTDAGPRRCKVSPTKPSAGGASVDQVEVLVEMGVARRGEDLVAVIGGREHRFFTVDMGNPHAISFEPHGQGALDVLGPAVAGLPPGGTNVELVQSTMGAPQPGPRTPPPSPQLASANGLRDEPPVLIVEVWERGVGRTLACGTGACAVAAAACDTGRATFDSPIIVVLPGGPLEVTVAAASRAVRMRGPARRVFSGEVEIA
jgi:diaminopimelate epimerase